MRHGADASIIGRTSVLSPDLHIDQESNTIFYERLDRLTQSSQELTKLTGKRCLPLQADVRKHEQLRDAVAKTIEKFGRIDFVICGMC